MILPTAVLYRQIVMREPSSHAPLGAICISELGAWLYCNLAWKLQRGQLHQKRSHERMKAASGIHGGVVRNPFVLAGYTTSVSTSQLPAQFCA